MTCRVFGPPVRTEEGLGICELCYEGASPEQIAACELVTGSEALEETLNGDAERLAKTSGQTIIAFCLSGK